MSAERFELRRLTSDEIASALAVADEARRFRAELCARSSAEPVTDSAELLRELREERTRQLE